MDTTSMTLEEALGHTRMGDIWLFRGTSTADRAIQMATNAPVNHVGMAVVLDDLPPLMWHAELGRSLQDMWTGRHQRGVQLHDLHAAVRTWHDKYGQQAWLRQLHVRITPEMEDAVLRTIAALDGTPFPSTTRLAGRWVKGRARGQASLEQLFCAEVVAATYAEMGLLRRDKPENWYDPGRFWSGDKLGLTADAVLGEEVHIEIPPRPAQDAPPPADQPAAPGPRPRLGPARDLLRAGTERIRREVRSLPRPTPSDS